MIMNVVNAIFLRIEEASYSTIFYILNINIH